MLNRQKSQLKALLLCAGLICASGVKADTIQVTSNLTGSVTWYSTNEYVLNGFIYVLTNSTLTLEPGTVVRGKAGTGLNSASLFITQGAKIFANGTTRLRPWSPVP